MSAWSNPQKSIALVKKAPEASHLQYLADIKRLETELAKAEARGEWTGGIRIELSAVKEESMRTDKQRADEEAKRQEEFAARKYAIVLWTQKNADIGPQSWITDKDVVFTGDEIDLQKVRTFLVSTGYKKTIYNIGKSCLDVKVAQLNGYDPNNYYYVC